MNENEEKQTEEQEQEPIHVYLSEPPPIKFSYCVDVMGKWIGASLLYAALFGILYLIFTSIFHF